MDGSLHFRPSARVLGALFEEDFDRPESAAEPEVIEPIFSAAELADAREAAWRAGNAAGAEEAAAGDAAAARRAIESIAAQFADARDAAATLAEQTADAIARLLLDSLAAAFPVLCASCGEAEVQAIVRSVLPALNQEQAVTVRTNPLTARSLLREIGRLDPDFAARVQIVECDSDDAGRCEDCLAQRCGCPRRHRDFGNRWRRSWRLPGCCGPISYSTGRNRRWRLTWNWPNSPSPVHPATKAARRAAPASWRRSTTYRSP